MREITMEGLAERLRRFVSAKARSAALLHAAAEVARQAQKAAIAKGGRSFWRDMADSVSWQPDGQGGYIVGASHVAAAQKQFGGPISAPGKGPGSLHATMLTIPLGLARENRWTAGKAKAMGFTLFRAGNVLMGKKKGGDAQPLFALAKEVSQGPDPWFPEGRDLQNAVDKGIQLYLKTQANDNHV